MPIYGPRCSLIRKLSLGIVVIFLSITIASLVFLSSSVVTEPSPSHVVNYIQSSSSGCRSETVALASFDGDDKGSVSCPEAKRRAVEEEWSDPNDGRVFMRRLISDPPFYVSVHNSSYDAVRWDSIFEKGKYYEDLVHDRFQQILSGQPNALVLDVGANIGYYTLLSLALGHNVIGFEINPSNILRVCESLTFNGWGHNRVAVFQNGVSDKHGTPLQVLVPRNPGQAYMKEIDNAESLHRIQDTNITSSHHAFTTTVTLDQFAQDRKWFSRPSFSVAILKLDVEGKEPQIIHGAKKLLQSGIVKNVLTEFRRLAREPIQDAVSTLFSCGYTLVHETKGKLSRSEAVVYFRSLTDKYKGKQRNFDLWFQIEEEIDNER